MEEFFFFLFPQEPKSGGVSLALRAVFSPRVAGYVSVPRTRPPCTWRAGFVPSPTRVASKGSGHSSKPSVPTGFLRPADPSRCGQGRPRPVAVLPPRPSARTKGASFLLHRLSLSFLGFFFQFEIKIFHRYGDRSPLLNLVNIEPRDSPDLGICASKGGVFYYVLDN